MVINIPLKILYECVGHNVTIELKSNEMYRGIMHSMDDTMNANLANVTYIARDGQTKYMDRVFIRGSQIRFFSLPAMMAVSPELHMKGFQAKGLGRPPADGITKQQAQQQHQMQQAGRR